MVDPKLQDVCNFLNKSSKKDVKQAFTLHSRKLNPTMFIQVNFYILYWLQFFFISVVISSKNPGSHLLFAKFNLFLFKF